MGDYEWPFVTEELRQRVGRQLASSLSDRAGTGVIREFEEAFAGFAEAKHAVSFASGTAALHAMAVACRIGEGDSVIASAYGFPATVSPFSFAGAEVRFADATPAGQLDIAEVADLIDETTRAIIVAHIWGNTEDCQALRTLCDARGLQLLQDASHAHFARWHGQHVARFAHATAYSLNQKAITCGEGGVLVTDEADLAARALLVGDYNHRCKTRPLPESLAPLVITGQGLKTRPHPLALAVGLHELERAGDIAVRRRATVEVFTNAALAGGLTPLVPASEVPAQHGLYMFACVAPSPEAARELHVRADDADCWSLDLAGATGLIAHHSRFQQTGALREAAAPDLAGARRRFPVAARLAESVVKLPLWGYPGDEQVVARYADVLSRGRA